VISFASEAAMCCAFVILETVLGVFFGADIEQKALSKPGRRDYEVQALPTD
jgi:hypothetical protein